MSLDTDAVAFALLEEGVQAEEMTFSRDADDEQMALANRLVEHGLLEVVSAMYGGTIYRVTARGESLYHEAQQSGVQRLDYRRQERPGDTIFNNTANGNSAVAVLGNHNSIRTQVQVQQGADPSELLAQIKALLPELGVTEDAARATVTLLEREGSDSPGYRKYLGQLAGFVDHHETAYNLVRALALLIGLSLPESPL